MTFNNIPKPPTSINDLPKVKSVDQVLAEAKKDEREVIAKRVTHIETKRGTSLEALAAAFAPRHTDRRTVETTKINNNGWNNRSAGSVNWDKAEAKRDDFVSTAASGKNKKSKGKK